MPKLEQVAAIFAFAVLPAAPLVAQAARGVVVTPDSSPVAGVIVVAKNARGDVVGRALTNDRGAFVLRLPTAGQFTLGVLRIGYRPGSGPSIQVGTDTLDGVRVRFASEAVRLAGVTIDAHETCRVSADTGLLVTGVWQEARKAMLSTQLWADGAPLVAEWIEYDRTLDAAGRVRDQHVRTSRNPTTHAFRGAPAQVLETRGYVVTEGDVTTFHAPDPEALLSDVFASGHCFHLAASPATDDRLIGVGFQPIRERREMREIEGILWLDRSSAELRRLEFRYTNLPEAARAAGAGGEVEFLRLDDGNWLVSRWNVRMPELTSETPMFSGLRRIVVSGKHVAVRGLKVSGGEVINIVRRDTVLYQLMGSEIVVQVVGGDSLIRPSRAVLTLDGTGYLASANAAGRIELSPVLPGRYRARVRTSQMDAFGMTPITLDIEARAVASVETVRLPGAPTLLEVVVSDVDGAPLSRVTLEARAATGPPRTVVTGADGRAILENLPPGLLALSARRLGFEPGRLSTSIVVGPNVLPIVMSKVSPPMLDTVRVVGTARTVARLQEFETRRINHRATASITRDDILKRNPTETWQMLTNLPSVRIIDVNIYGMVMAAAPRTVVANFKSEVCYYLVAVDGVPLNATPAHKAVDLRSLPSPDEVHGIEVFAGAASIPVQYGGAGDGKWCGLIAIWTR